MLSIICRYWLFNFYNAPFFHFVPIRTCSPFFALIERARSMAFFHFNQRQIPTLCEYSLYFNKKFICFYTSNYINVERKKNYCKLKMHPCFLHQRRKCIKTNDFLMKKKIVTNKETSSFDWYWDEWTKEKKRQQKEKMKK